jgi:hypothetical protein
MRIAIVPRARPNASATGGLAGRVRDVEAEGGTPDAALRFWAIVIAGLVAAPPIGWGVRAAFDRRRVVEPGLAARLRAAFIKLLVASGGLAVFRFLFCAALMAVSMGRQSWRRPPTGWSGPRCNGGWPSCC